MPFVCGYMGKIATEPNLKQISDGKFNCKFRLLNREYWGGSNKDNFIPCIAWGKAADVISRNFKKGDFIIVEGSWHNTPWLKNEKGYDIPNWQFNIQKVFFIPNQKAKDDDDFISENPILQMSGINRNDETLNYDEQAPTSNEFAPISDNLDDLPF